jgi:hypothetical protein
MRLNHQMAATDLNIELRVKNKTRDRVVTSGFDLLSERLNGSEKTQNRLLGFDFYCEITPSQYEMIALVENRPALQTMPMYPPPRVVDVAREAGNAVASSSKVWLFWRPVLANAGREGAAC